MKGTLKVLWGAALSGLNLQSLASLETEGKGIPEGSERTHVFKAFGQRPY